MYNRLRWRDVNVGNPGDIQGCKSVLFKIKSIAVQTAPRGKKISLSVAANRNQNIFLHRTEHLFLSNLEPRINRQEILNIIRKRYDNE